MGINLLAQKVDKPKYPSLAETVTMGENVRGAQARNLLAEKRLSTYDEDREFSKEMQEADKMFKVMNAISKVPSKEGKKALWNQVYPGQEMPDTSEGQYSAIVGGKLLTVNGDPAQVEQFSNFLANHGAKLTEDNLPGVFNAANKAGLKVGFKDWDKKTGFTLSPGQTRFGPDGKPLARVGATTKKDQIQTPIYRKNPETGEYEEKVGWMTKGEDYIPPEGWRTSPFSEMEKAGFGPEEIDRLAEGVKDGTIDINSIRNTMGKPIQAMVMANVLRTEPDFNFRTIGVATKAIQGAMNNIVKQGAAMGPVVKNMGKQVERVDVVIDLLKRTDAKLLNMPVRAALEKIKGSANEQIVRAYLFEISSEVAKLSTGSTGSVREVSVQAAEKWDKVHDSSLPILELRKVLEESVHMGNMRMESQKEEIFELENSLTTLNQRINKSKGGGGTKTIKTQAEYDALPDGSTYIYEGEEFTKGQ